MRTSRTLKRSALTALILAQASIHAAKAQAIDTEYMLPLPNGTNLIEASGALNTANAFHFTNGQDAHDSSLTEYDFDFRFAHYMDIEGYTAGIQLFQTAAYTSNLKVGGVSTNGQGVATLGAGNTTFSAFFFPYQTKEEEKKTDVFTAVYLTPPDGTYSSNPNRISSAFGGWQGDMQVGLVKGITEEFSLQGAFDIQLHGNQPIDGGAHIGTAPTYRAQVWAIYEWSEAVGTSIGYTSVFGGAQTFSGPAGSASTYTSDERQRIRAEATYWWNPHTLTSLEVAHDIYVPGGFQSVIDTEAKIKLLF
jgi:hypothetical protein